MFYYKEDTGVDDCILSIFKHSWYYYLIKITYLATLWISPMPGSFSQSLTKSVFKMYWVDFSLDKSNCWVMLCITELGKYWYRDKQQGSRVLMDTGTVDGGGGLTVCVLVRTFASAQKAAPSRAYNSISTFPGNPGPREHFFLWPLWHQSWPRGRYLRCSGRVQIWTPDSSSFSIHSPLRFGEYLPLSSLLRGEILNLESYQATIGAALWGAEGQTQRVSAELHGSPP